MKFLKFRSLSRISSLVLFFLLSLVYYAGKYHVEEFVFAERFQNFTFPLEIDMPAVVDKVLKGETVDIKPLHDRLPYPFVLNAANKCKNTEGSPESVFLLILIKSRIESYKQRQMIRRTWAREFEADSVIIKRVFLVGVSAEGADKTWQQRLSVEQQVYNDIVQQNFIDAYLNNTLKMIMGFQWTIEFCDSAKFVAFFDDDYYVNMNHAILMLQAVKPAEFSDLIIGYVWNRNIPFRNRDNKWYISLEEYPFRYYPPYVTAGSFFIPMQTVRRLYAAMPYTKLINFDDVYLGIVAWKLKVRLWSHPDLYVFYYPYTFYGYRNVIAAHGFADTDLLYRAWKEQMSLEKKL